MAAVQCCRKQTRRVSNVIKKKQSFFQGKLPHFGKGTGNDGRDASADPMRCWLLLLLNPGFSLRRGNRGQQTVRKIRYPPTHAGVITLFVVHVHHNDVIIVKSEIIFGLTNNCRILLSKICSTLTMQHVFPI